MAIFITGDTHGDFIRFKKKIFYEQAELTKDDCVMIAGDFGGIWDGSAEERHWLDWLEAKPYTTLFVSGNDENFDLLARYPVEDWHGGQVQRVRPSVIHLMRGQVYEIQGKTFFTMGGGQSHDIDAGILQYLMNKYGMDIDKMLNVLNKKSGVQGVSGVSSDFRDLCAAAESGNGRAALALDMFSYGVKKYIGAYAAAMGGVDAIIFTAGVGENDGAQRMAIASGLEFMGVKMDADANNIRGKEAIISAIDSKVKVLLIPTNEELMIALDTAELA